MQRSLLRNPVLGRIGLALFGFTTWLGFSPEQLLAQPANDNFANAIVLVGPSGSTNGSNIGATREPNEPNITANLGGKSVWYAWTAPADMTVTFFTFGSDFDTLLGVYGGTGLTNLTLVAENDNYGRVLQSSVTFHAANNTTYYIAVDGFNTGAGYGASQGTLTLTWGSSIGVGLAAGDFRFTSSYYLYSDSESFAPLDPRGAMIGLPARLTITRERGSAGKVQVAYSITNGLYTNVFEYLYISTNIFSTNIDYNTNTGMSTVSGFTNTFITNYVAGNFFQDMQFGTLTYLLEIDQTNTAITNISVTGFNNNTTNVVSTNDIPAVPPEFVTCVSGITVLPPVQVTSTSANTNVVTTNYTTVIIFCQLQALIAGMQVVPSATAGLDYNPSVGVTNFDDFQMSADLFVDILLPQPFHEGFIPGNLGFWINRYLVANITGVSLDPLENQAIAPPTAATALSNTVMNVLNQFTWVANDLDNNPHTADSGRLGTNIFFLERATLRCTRNVNGFHDAVVYGLRFTIDPLAAATDVQYRIDHLKGPPTDNGNNIFPQNPDEIPLQAGSDYALPPGAAAYGIDPDFDSVTGTLSWGQGDLTAKPIVIPIHNLNKVEFNEDFLVELHGVPPNATDKFLSPVHTCVVTILFDNERGDVQPAGAVDRMHNMDNDSSTLPHPFNLHPGANGTVYGVAIQPDGRCVIGGDFTGFNTEVRGRLARMDANGLLDSTFNPPGGADRFVSSLLIDAVGNIVAGGAFNSMNGVPRKGIARLFPDGSLDNSFFPGAGANDIVWALAFHTNGSILVGGQFLYFNNLPRTYLARLDSTGALDPGFAPALDGVVNAITVQSDGSILIGGDFSTVNGTPRAHVARLNADGSLDTSFDPGYGADNTVYALAVQPDRRVVVAGSFGTFGAQSRSAIARLNPDGTIDSTFDPGDGADDTIYSLNLQLDGKIIAAGMFSTYSQTRRMGLVRIFADGTVDTSFMDTGYNQYAGLPKHFWDPNSEPHNFIFSTALQGDGNLMIGGGFPRVGGGFTRTDVRQRENVARIIGGSTPGPGNIELTYPSYSADQFSDQVFINLTRTNGNLGFAGCTIGPSSTAPGPGSAVDGQDYVFNPTYANPLYITSWSRPTWMLSDGTYGQNNTFAQTIDPATGLNYLNNKVYISILDNTNMSGNRSFNMRLSKPTGTDLFHLGFGPLDANGYYAGENIPLGVGLGRSEAPFTIIDFHTQPGTLGFTSPTYVVGEGGTNALITVIRTNGTANLVTVQFATANGTATNGIHYSATNGTLRFLPGITNQSFAIRLIDESIKEGDHTVLINLSNPGGGASLGSSNAVLTIVDNDIVGGYIHFDSSVLATNANGPYAVYGTNENAVFATVTVSRNGGAAGLLTARFTATNGSAISGLNFTGVTNTLSWVNGDVQPKVIPIRLFDDGVVENAPMTINLALAATALNGTTNLQNLGVPGSAVLYLTNSDFTGQFGFSTPSYSVNENGGPAIITVVRSGGSAGPASVSFATSPGTASPSDFGATNGTLFFGPGDVSKSFLVNITNNNVVNLPRFVALSLANASPAGALGSPASAILNIIDDESVNNPAGDPDPTINPAFGFNDAVYTLWQQPDGKLLAGGDFTLADGLTRTRVARLNPDFSLDTTFSSTLPGYGANGSVLGMLAQTDLRVLVGGQFTTFNGLNANYLARLNADGSLDSTFNIGAAADNPVYALAETFVGSDRKLLVGGAFLHFNGQPANYILRLNNNGFLDGAFVTGSGPDGAVHAIMLQPDGKFFIGGDFTAFNGVARNRIARLNANGSLDLSFDPGTGASDSVRAIAVQSDGRVLIGGAFTNVNGVALNHIARLNADGSIDASFNVGIGANDQVATIALQPDTRIILGGQFTFCNGVTRRRITRLNNDGTVDTMINFGLGANNFVAATLVQTNGMIVLAGGFTSYKGQAAGRIERIYGGTISGPGSLEFDSPFYQVNEDGTNTVVNVIRRQGTTGAVAIDFNTSDQSAIAGLNYLPVSAHLTFPPGEVLQTATVPILRDYAVTTNLTVGLNLSNPQGPGGPTVGNVPSATLTIVNVDSGVSFSQSFYSFAENDLSGFALINVVRVGSTNGSASVDFYTLTNGTAVPFVNFIPVTNTISFAPGQVSNFVTVPLIHTLVAEGDTTVPLLLTNANHTLLLTPSRATLNIVDVDRYPGQFVFSQTNYFVSEGGGAVNLTLLRTNGHSGAVTVNYQTSDGSAQAGYKYVSTNGTLTFADGELSKTIVVPILEENQVEGNTTFFVSLSNPGGGATFGGPATSMVTIIDDDLGVAFSSPIFIGTETDGSITLGINRVGTNGITAVSYATTNGTAIAGTNFLSASGTLTFNPGESFKTFNVGLLHDPRVTGPLSFTIGLYGATAPAQIYANNPATVTINDADPGFAFTNANFYTIKSGTNVLITVVRSNANTGLVTVNFATADGTAASGVDYTATNGLLTFSNGIALQSFTVPIINNRLVEGDRLFSINLLNPANLSNPSIPAQLVTPSTASVTITDDVSGLSFSSPVYTVNENGVSATITVLRTGYTSNTVSVAYATADGSGIAGVNYVPAAGTLTFTNGETVKTFSVPLIDDSVVNGDKTVLLNLTGASGNAVFVSPSAATLTILETDGSLIVPAGTALVSESGPINNAIDPGERVGVMFAFRVATGTNTMNLVATLLATNGVASPSGPQTYGALKVHGPSVSRLFSFNANVTNGQVLSATFQLTDGNGPTNLVPVNFVVGQLSATFSNVAPIIINDETNATPYPAVINVAGLAGLVAKTTVTFSNLTHSWPSDIDALLVSPAGQSTYLMAKAGSHFSINNLNLTFDDAAFQFLPQSSQISTLVSSYKPTCYAVSTPPFTVPAPPAPYKTNLATFNQSNPNGAWSLYIIDDTAFNAGIVSNGWLLTLSTASPILGNADLGLTVTTSPNPVVLGNNLTYTFAVTNYGPSTATSIVITDALPAGAAYISSSPSAGSASTNGAGVLTWTISSLATNGGASLSLVLRPSVTGSLSNSATAASAVSDLNPDNNTATALVSVSAPTADLALSMSGTPNPVLSGNFITYALTISNLGPAVATGVSLTDTLPPGVSLFSATPPGYTVNGNSVTFANLGNLASGTQTSASIVVRPFVGGTITNNATVTSATTDPSKLNNNASVKIVVTPVVMSVAHSGGNLVLAWTADSSASSYSLYGTASLTPPTVWAPVTNTPIISGGMKTVTLPVGSGTEFFRLQGVSQ